MSASLVLVVDDDWMNREVMQSFFEHAGYQVIVATNGNQALQLAHTHHPALAMIDVRMSDLSGYEVCHLLKSDTQTQNVKVVLITALERKEDRVYAQEARADDFVSKSLEWPAIVERVGLLLTH
jgi:CheY-like chemotaxis protein